MRKVGVVFFALVMVSTVVLQAMGALTEADIKNCVDSPEKFEALLQGKEPAEVGAAAQAIIKAVAESGASDRVANGRIALITAYVVKLTGAKSASVLPGMVQAAGKYETSVIASATVAAKKVCPTEAKAVVAAAAGAAKNKAAAQEAAKTPGKVLGRLVVWKVERAAGPGKVVVATKATTTTTTTTTTQPKDTPTPVGKM